MAQKYSEDLYSLRQNPVGYYGKVESEDEYTKNFGDFLHPFTGINMVDFYRELVKDENCDVEFVFSNDPKTILDYTKDILVCDIHTRDKTKKLLSNASTNVYGLCDIMSEAIGDTGFNPMYVLLVSNKSTEEKLKLFPKTGDVLVKNIHDKLSELT